MVKRLDAHSIQTAFSYFEGQLEYNLPNVISQEYAQLWAEEGLFLPAPFALDLGTEYVSEYISEGVGEGVEINDLSDDIPMVSVTQDKTRYQVRHFALSYGYNIIDMARQAKSGVNLNTKKMLTTDMGLRQMVHNTILFGTPSAGKPNPRGFTGLYNNPNVPVQATGYNPNSADWDAHVEFIMSQVTQVEIRNQLAGGVDQILTDKAHLFKLNTTYKDGVSVAQALTEIFSRSNPGFKGINAVNESSPVILEQFGVKPAGSNETRMILMPTNPLVMSYGRIAPDYLEPERRGLTFKVAAINGTSDFMIHAPNEMSYVDFSQATFN